MKLRNLIPVLALTLLAAGCRIEPPLHLRQVMNVIVNVIWKAEVYPEGIKPDGVTLYVFRNDEFYMQHTTADVDSCRVNLLPGRYRIYMVSQSPDEFSTMTFHNMDDIGNAYIRLTDNDVSWLESNPDAPVVCNPEMLTVGVSDEFEVTEELIEEIKKGDYVIGDDEEGYVRFYTLRVPVTPMSVISQFWVSIYSANADMLKAVRASTSGMARTFYITQGVTGDEECTQVISEWSLAIDDPETRVGHLDGKITTLGLPRGEMPSIQRDSTLNVATLLIDNKTVDKYTFFVGNQIFLDDPPPQGYLHLYRLILGTRENPVITPSVVNPPGSESGFDAIVDDWEEGDELEVNM